MAPTSKGFYGEHDLKQGQLIRVVLTGTITVPNAMDSCMQVMTSSGMYHYIFDGDPAAVILKQSQSWPPKPEDVWLFGSKLWHADNRGMLAYASRAGGFTTSRQAESVLHAAGSPPELLFRWRV